jgi:hypothetical protein
VLTKAGIKDSAVEVIFDGADFPVNDKTPDFKKSLPLTKAMDDSTIIAFSMNEVPLPEKQGFPARLVVPGWTATYWIKQLIKIEVSSVPFDGFWMKKAYRVPIGKFSDVQPQWPSQTNETNTPITEIIVNSLVTGSKLKKIGPKLNQLTISGFAWDKGSGIDKVEVSNDNGKSWHLAKLEPIESKLQTAI